MFDSIWHWMTGCIYGECESCGEALWDDHEMLVLWRDRSYHLNCLLHRYPDSIQNTATTSFAVN
jgi:hypothetical protein